MAALCTASSLQLCAPRAAARRSGAAAGPAPARVAARCRTPRAARRVMAPVRASSEEQGDAKPDAPPPKKRGMSAEQKAKLRAEYIGFGGSEKQAMDGNPFLNIMLGITGLVLIAYLGGIRP